MKHLHAMILGLLLAICWTPTAWSKSAGAQFGWDLWYVVLADHKIPAAYYNEKVQAKDNRIHLELKIVKKEEGFLNEENMGLFTQDTPALAPLFYNYRMTYKTSETRIDGTLDPKNYLNIKAVRNGSALPPVQRHVPPGAIFSYSFPVWLAKKFSGLKEGQRVSFTAVNEDQLEQDFPFVTGYVQPMKPDATAKKTGTRLVLVNYQDVTSNWYVKDNGVALMIDRPATKTLIRQVSKSEALGFLK